MAGVKGWYSAIGWNQPGMESSGTKALVDAAAGATCAEGVPGYAVLGRDELREARGHLGYFGSALNFEVDQ